MEPLVVREGLAVVPLRAEVVEVAPTTREDHLVLVNVGAPYRLVEDLEGTTRRTPGLPGDVAVVPAGASFAVRSLDGRPQQVESLGLLVSPEALEEVYDAAGVVASQRRLVPVVGARSPQVASLASLLRAALPQADGLRRLALEALASAMAVAVAAEHQPAPAAPPTPTGGLSTGQLSRVVAHVEERLAGPLPLASLAAVAHTSPFHFARQFRLSTGTSPHQYVLERRLARADELLRGTSLPLAEVAARCGFADQSHLTRVVRRRLGDTPARVRAANR